jgi:hypothetical protein
MSKISSAEYKANSSLLGFVEAPLIFERSSESLLFRLPTGFFPKASAKVRHFRELAK